ncbi:MAG: alginate lyase family protein [Planctomycetota bacterium]
MRASGVLLDCSDIERSKAMIEAGDPALMASRDALLAQADAAMDLPVRPVTSGKEDGKRLAPSGDPKDYVSLSPYWWPDPSVPSGEPYIRRDGEINPERHEYDTPKLGDFGKAVRLLAFAYAFTGDEAYAERAIEHVRAWFVTPETRMNPAMRFAQFVPGVSLGRRVGIIDTNRLRWMPDSLIILSASPSWTGEDTRETKRWFGEYAEWLMTSDLGIAERNSSNNHGTWFDAQVVQYSLYSGRTEIALEILEGVPERINAHFAADGSQPHELERTRALDYTDFNLRAYLDLFKYAARLDVEMAKYENAEGATIEDAIDWGIPYFVGDKDFPYKQISPPKYHMYYQMLRSASKLYNEPRYEAAAQRLPENDNWLVWVDLVLPADFEQ